MRACADCGEPFEVQVGPGRPRLYCSRCASLRRAAINRRANRARYRRLVAAGRIRPSRAQAKEHGSRRLYRQGCRCEVCCGEEAVREIEELTGAA